MQPDIHIFLCASWNEKMYFNCACFWQQLSLKCASWNIKSKGFYKWGFLGVQCNFCLLVQVVKNWLWTAGWNRVITERLGSQGSMTMNKLIIWKSQHTVSQWHFLIRTKLAGWEYFCGGLLKTKKRFWETTEGLKCSEHLGNILADVTLLNIVKHQYIH